MATTTNLGLYKPTVGETGWGALVDANFDTLDALSFGLNVKSFGALGDGSTDDLDAIQAAIDAAEATGPSGAAGNVVFMPAGIYMVSDSIIMDTSYVRLVGANDNAVRIKATSAFPTTTDQAVIEMGPHPTGNGDISGVTLENLRVDGTSRASVGINVNDGNEHCAIRNVEVRNVVHKGLFVTATNALVVDRFGAEGGSAATYIIHLYYNTGAIWLSNLSNITADATPVTAGSAGVRIDHTPCTVIQNFHCEHLETGIHFATGSGSGYVCNAGGHSSMTDSVLTIDPAYASDIVFYANIFTNSTPNSVKDVPGGYIYSSDVTLMAQPPTPTNITILPSSLGSASSTVSSTTVVMTVTQDVPVGDFVIVAGNWGGTSNTPVSVTDSGGNTYQLDKSVVPSGAPANIPGDAVIASSKIGTALTANVSTITLTVTNATSSKIICALTAAGLATSSWLDKTASDNTQTTSPFSSGNTATTSQASELLIGLQANGTNSAGSFAATPWSQVVRKTIAGARQLQLGMQVVSATGAYAFTGTLTTAEQYVAAIATYKYA